MPSIKLLVCLANSRKHNGRCIAGIEIVDRRPSGWVRPVSDRPGSEVSEDERHYRDGSEPKVLDLMEVSLLNPCPDGYQAENWLLDATEWWVRRGQVTWSTLATLADEDEPLWPDDAPSTFHGANDRVRAEQANNFDDSLRLIQVTDLTIRVLNQTTPSGSRRRVQGDFTYLGTKYGLAVTDPLVTAQYLAFENGDHRVGECFLTISLGELFDGYAYKLIAAVITKHRAPEGD